MSRSAFGLNLLGNHFPALHGLRVLGILSVIQIHLSFELVSRGFLDKSSLVYLISQRVWFGMDLFFFLSGFLIGTILLGEAGGARRTLRFYVRRSFRIIPLYYVVLTLLVWITPLDPIQRAQLPREYLYLTNYSDPAHVVMFWGWSLCVEEHFYLLIPLLMAVVKWVPSHRGRIVLLGLLWLSGFCVRAWIVYGGAVPGAAGGYFRYVYIPTHARYDILMAGVLLAYLLKTEGERLRSWMARPPVRAATALASLLCFAALLSPNPHTAPLLWSLLAIGTLTGAAYFLLVVSLITGDGVLARFLGGRPFLWFATLGYGVYLVHMPLVLLVGLGAYSILVRTAGLAPGVAFGGSVLLVFTFALGFAYVLHLFIEKPALAIRDRVTRDRAPGGG